MVDSPTHNGQGGLNGGIGGAGSNQGAGGSQGGIGGIGGALSGINNNGDSNLNSNNNVTGGGGNQNNNNNSNGSNNSNEFIHDTVKMLMAQLKQAGDLIDESKTPLAKSLQRGTVAIMSMLSEECHPTFKQVKEVKKALKERSLYSLSQTISVKKTVHEALQLLASMAVPEMEGNSVVEAPVLDPDLLQRIVSRINGFRAELTERQICESIGSVVRQSAGCISTDDNQYYDQLRTDFESFNIRLTQNLQNKVELTKIAKELKGPYQNPNGGSKKNNNNISGGANTTTQGPKWCFRFLCLQCGYRGVDCRHGKHPSQTQNISPDEYSQLQKSFPFLTQEYNSWLSKPQQSLKGKGQGKGGASSGGKGGNSS